MKLEIVHLKETFKRYIWRNLKIFENTKKVFIVLNELKTQIKFLNEGLRNLIVLMPYISIWLCSLENKQYLKFRKKITKILLAINVS